MFPVKGLRPGAVIPGELGEELDGARGAEKLRLPRLPKDPPPPARAQAVDSRKVAAPKKKRTDSAKPVNRFLFISNVSPCRLACFQTPDASGCLVKIENLLKKRFPFVAVMPASSLWFVLPKLTYTV